jgi:hypothetical protein
VIFGAIYDRFGAPTAFTVGAAAALFASVGLWIVVPSAKNMSGGAVVKR